MFSLTISQYFGSAYPFMELCKFPDKEFCIFKDFPLNQLINIAYYDSDISLTSHSSIFCSCVLLWLMSPNFYNSSGESVLLYCNNHISLGYVIKKTGLLMCRCGFRYITPKPKPITQYFLV